MKKLLLLLLIPTFLFSQNWNQIGQDIDGVNSSDDSGESVAISDDGTIVVIGAPEADGVLPHGCVRVFENINGIWTQLGQNLNPQGNNHDFGESVAISNDGYTIAVGAPEANNTQGYAQVYRYNGTSWNQLGNNFYSSANGDYVGTSVSLSGDGNILAVGAKGWNGEVDVWEWNGSSWFQLGADLNGYTSGDQFGYSVSLSDDGTRMAVGSPTSDGMGIGTNAGKVQVFEYNPSVSNNWVQVGQYIQGEGIHDHCGYSVSLSSNGNTVAIGARYNDGNGINSTGHVRIYNWNNGSWNQVGQDIDGEAESDDSGCSVSISNDGNTVAIGAISNDDNGSWSGHTRIYNWNGTWNQVGQDIDGEAAGDYSGKSVSISGNGSIVAIGAPYNDGNGTDAGHVRVYQYPVPGCMDSTALNYSPNATIDDGSCIAVVSGCTDSTAFNYNPLANTDDGSCCYDTIMWSQISDDIMDNLLDQSGYSVSISDSGNIIAIGSPDYDNNNSTGRVSVYQKINEDWVQLGQDINGDILNEWFGYSISLSSDGSILAVGAPSHNVYNSSQDTGYVRIFQWDGSSWNQLGQDIEGDDSQDKFGSTVSLSSDGSRIAISAPEYGTSSNPNSQFDYERGKVKVYELINSSWNQIGQDFVGTGSYVRLGYLLSLSGNGNVLCMYSKMQMGGSYPGEMFSYEWNGSSWVQFGQNIPSLNNYTPSSLDINNDGSKLIIGNGWDNSPGYVRVFSFDGVNWTQIGNTINGISGSDRFGYSVSISNDGNTIAAGAIEADAFPFNEMNQGHIRVFNWDGSLWDQVGQDINGKYGLENSGWSVALNGDGSSLIVGIPENQSLGLGQSHGAARVYQLKLNICISGCTDSSATNYNPSSIIDDGSCIYCNNDTSYTNITSCDSVLWNGNWYNQSGIYDTTFSISSGYTISPNAKEGNNWCFGWSAGLDFNGGTPVAAICSFCSDEGCYSISDKY